MRPNWSAVMRPVADTPNMVRLLGVRLLSQFTDGLFQAALGSAIIFNPERSASAGAIAAGLAVLLLPYSIIGPFAGALLDRWDRRQVFIWANLLRAVLIGVVATTVAAGASDHVILLGALVVGGASRFVASGLSAALPHVVTREQVVSMNSITTTLGSGATAVGACAAVLLRGLVGADNTGSAMAVLTASVSALIGAFVATRFARSVLGPDLPPPADSHPASTPPTSTPPTGAPPTGSNPLGTGRAIATGLSHGALAVWRSPPVSAALTAVGAHRIVFGLNTLMLLLLTRHYFTDHSGIGGLAGFTLVGAAIAIGIFIAAVVTPILVGYLGRRSTVMGALVVAAAAELLLLTINFMAIVIAALIIGLAGQVIKLCGDASMQLDIPDDNRGQVFAFQDALFNATFVAAVAVGVLVLPEDGRSRGTIVVAALIYLGAVGWVAVLSSHKRTHSRGNRSGAPDV